VPGTFLSSGRRWLLPVSLALACAALASCFSAKDPNEGCDDISEYQASRSVPGIVLPEGLSAPNHSSSFVVPPGGAMAGDPEAPQPGAACLSRPPDFFRKDPEPPAK
jgi:uncharacterized lipoprotein